MTLFRRPRVRVGASIRHSQYISRHAPIGANDDSRTDKWLQRLSHLSQFGLFLITIATIYFTVLPLYQKALLDEAIARKEIELKQAMALLDKAYKRVQVNASNDFVNYSMRACSGLFIQIDETGRSPKTLIGTALGIDIYSCLQNSLREVMPRSELRPEDQVKFERSVLALASSLKKIEDTAIFHYKEVPSIAKRSPERLPVPQLGRYERQVQEDVEKWMAALGKVGKVESTERRRQREIDFAASHEQSRTVRAYRDEVARRIVELRKFDWVAP